MMEGIAKYVLEMAGQGKDEFYLPESKCIRVEDVEVGTVLNDHGKKVLTSVGLPELDNTSTSRQYLYGASLCIDSISPSRIEKACSLITAYLQDFVDVDELSVSPSPLLQDYMICQPAMDDGVTLTTYCERMSTVSMK